MERVDSKRQSTSDADRRPDNGTLEIPDGDPLRRRVLEARERARAADSWALESPSTTNGGPAQLTWIRPLPFRVGRGPDVQLRPASPHVSKAHAEIYSDGESLRVRDLGSRNGTFLNRQAVSDAPLHEGDILHFGDQEYRLAQPEKQGATAEDPEMTLQWDGPLPKVFPSGAHELPDLMKKRAVAMVFQPIVKLPSNEPSACEALGRGRHPNLPENPMELFTIAERVGAQAAVELSRLFRHRAVEQVVHLAEPPALFLNTHPKELELPGLLESLEELRTFAPQVDLVLEIHESALTQTDFIAWLRNRLLEINVGVAYDDFGAGQARLFELAEAPPHYLKFDRRFVQGLHEAPISRQRLVASLVAAARELMVQTVAEGVETAEEAAACVRAGFSHAQGYYFGRPGPLEAA